jgi:transposase-like protein
MYPVGGTMSDKYECPECDMEFDLRRILHSHIDAKHGGSDEHAPWRDKETLRLLYFDKEYSMSEIADELGCTLPTVQKWMVRNGIERRSKSEGMKKGEEHHNYWGTQQTPKELRDESWIRERHYGEGLMKADIAELLGCSVGAVHNAFGRFDIGLNQDLYDGSKYDLLNSDLWIREKYVEEEMTTGEIASEVGCSPVTVYRNLIRHDIDVRTGREAVGSGSDHHRWKGGETDYGSSWTRQRRRALDRDGDQCAVCGTTSEEHIQKRGCDLHVHHVTPFRKYGVENHERANRLDNLITLCRTHHDQWEGLNLRPQTTSTGVASDD